MTFTRYVIQTRYVTGKIEAVKCAKETDHFIIPVRGFRKKKNTPTQETFDTWEEARDRLIEVQSGKVARLHSQYNSQRKILHKIMKMKEK